MSPNIFQDDDCALRAERSLLRACLSAGKGLISLVGGRSGNGTKYSFDLRVFDGADDSVYVSIVSSLPSIELVVDKFPLSIGGTEFECPR